MREENEILIERVTVRDFNASWAVLICCDLYLLLS